ncbi:MAG: STAS/SEC14 domain-containing protein [Hymenobacteraceae bacterium]|nr:STAS/SEC14 domain-containing protein [Hymenobacteraceae bacterium]MDX5396105.1 STAS/SEC14 domain-containing protein [Hymenobacteraceae bacterium]MDX5512170.1 STAS/SEC14 domain-containing protein [Hymenobacteraceae bacterium]
MIQLLEEPKDELVMLKMVSKLDQKDYDQVVPFLEKQIKQYGKIKVYLEIEDLEGMTAQAMWQEVKFDLSHRTDFAKIAITGDAEWLEWLARVSSYLIPAPIRHFKLSDKAAALQWLREK